MVASWLNVKPAWWKIAHESRSTFCPCLAWKKVHACMKKSRQSRADHHWTNLALQKPDIARIDSFFLAFVLNGNSSRSLLDYLSKEWLCYRRVWRSNKGNALPHLYAYSSSFASLRPFTTHHCRTEQMSLYGLKNSTTATTSESLTILLSTWAVKFIISFSISAKDYGLSTMGILSTRSRA